MNSAKKRKYFRSLLDEKQCIHPGSVFDPISARIAEDLGYETGIFAGSIASMTILGSPDLVLITLSEFVQQTNRICRAGNLALLVDADHGYGNALNVIRTVQELEAAGVAALTIEDTRLPKTYGSTDNPSILSLEESVSKMRAALKGRSDTDLVITARTSAFSITDGADAINRARAYESAGVDAIFFTGINSKEQIDLIASNISIPIFIAPKDEQIIDLAYLASKGVKICLQSHQPFFAAVQAVYATLRALRDGIPASQIKNIASDNLIKKVTQSDEYDKLIKDYL